VRHPDGRESRIAARVEEGGEYLRAADISLVLGASLHWRPDLLKMTIRLGEHRVKVTAENPNVIVDGTAIHLLSPVIYRDGDVYLPTELVGDVLAGLAPFPVRWDPERRTLFLGGGGARVLGARLEERPGGLEATVLTTGRPPFLEAYGTDGALEVRLAGVALQDESLPAPPEGGILRGWEWKARADTVVLRIFPGEQVVEHRIVRSAMPEALRIRLSSVPLVDFEGAASDAIELLTSSLRRNIDGETVVVIDPGHGGEDPGVSVGGASEGAAMLDLALRLRTALEEAGIARVVLTRAEDGSAGVRERTEAANRARGDLLVSLHVNASAASDVSGAEVYVRSIGRGGEDRIQRAAAEAAAIYAETPLGGALSGDIRFVPWEAVQGAYRAESRAAGRLIAGELSADGGAAARVKEAPIAVLLGAEMPGVLVEVGFATNEEDARRLDGDENRARIAGLLARGVASFLGGAE
jgi:N-acetylmuramoyl-L-alanine amidase